MTSRQISKPDAQYRTLRPTARLDLLFPSATNLEMSEPYDPYIPNAQRPGGANAASGGAGNAKTARVQQQVDEVVNIMQDNIDKVMQRGERLDDLRGKTEDLQATAGHFRRGANQVRKRMWWKDLKWKIIIGVTILVILAIIIGSIVGTQVK